VHFRLSALRRSNRIPAPEGHGWEAEESQVTSGRNLIVLQQVAKIISLDKHSVIAENVIH